MYHFRGRNHTLPPEWEGVFSVGTVSRGGVLVLGSGERTQGPALQRGRLEDLGGIDAYEAESQVELAMVLRESTGNRGEMWGSHEQWMKDRDATRPTTRSQPERGLLLTLMFA